MDNNDYNQIPCELNTIFKSSKIPPKNTNTCVIAKESSGASKYYFTAGDKQLLHGIQEYCGPPITLPNNTKVRQTEKGSLLFFSELSTEVKKVTVLPQLTNFLWVSIG